MAAKGTSVRLVFCLSFAVMAGVRSIFEGICMLSLRLSLNASLSGSSKPCWFMASTIEPAMAGRASSAVSILPEYILIPL